MIRPAGAQIRDACQAAHQRAVIAGRKESCGVPVTLRRQPGGEVAVDTNAAEAQAAACHNRLVLSDGTMVSIPA
jgi:hypothetical protein